MALEQMSDVDRTQNRKRQGTGHLKFHLRQPSR